MSTIQIKNVPEPLHEELRRRSDERGTTIRDYVLDLIRRDQAAPSPEQWRQAVRALEPADLGRPASAVLDDVRSARAGRR